MKKTVLVGLIALLLFGGCVSEPFCAELWEVFARVNKNFVDEQEVIDFLANELNEEHYSQSISEPNLSSVLMEISQKARNEEINNENLREVTFKQVIQENFELSNCWINVSQADLTNDTQTQVYSVKEEKWIITKDGRIIHFYSTGA